MQSASIEQDSGGLTSAQSFMPFDRAPPRFQIQAMPSKRDPKSTHHPFSPIRPDTAKDSSEAIKNSPEVRTWYLRQPCSSDQSCGEQSEDSW